MHEKKTYCPLIPYDQTIKLFEPGLMEPSNYAHWIWDFDAFINELEVNFGPQTT